MIKRMMTIMLTLLLLCGLTARAEEIYGNIDSALYRIVLRTEEGDTTLGSGVLFADQQVVLTALGCCRQGDLYVIGEDGEHKVLTRGEAEDAGLAILELATPSSGQPLMLASENTQGLPFIFGVNAEGKTGSVPLYRVRRSRYHDDDALALSGEEGLLPGAFMVDQQGQLVGLVIAQQMEGIGSYIALDANEIYDALMGDESQADAFLKTSLTWTEGMLNVAWQDETREGGMYVVTLSGGSNNYYTTYNTESTERSISLAVPPGHTYYVQVQWAESEEAALPPAWNAMETLTVTSTSFTAHGFTQECFLASFPAGREVNSVLKEMPLLSVDTLTDPKADIYLQIRCKYDVSTEFETPMALELIAPDGQFFYDEMGFTFSPEYEKDDSFVLPVDDMIATCARFSGGALQPGNYVLRYALNGQVAGEYAFTVQEAGTPSPAEEAPAEETSAVTGFAKGVAAQNENGLITLTWDAASIPAGAKVNVFCFYEGNTYYTYHSMKEGASSSQLFSVPGRRVMAWVVWATEGEVIPSMPEHEDEYAIIAGAEEEPLTDSSFRNVRIGLMPSDDPEAGTEMTWLPQLPLTREILSDRDTPLYFQTEDTYRISASSSDHPMVIVLMTPEGMCFVEPGYYIFDAALQQSDLWLKDISKLFADYESLVHTGAWPAGEYRILYCIDEKIAGEFTFTLE